MSDDTGASDQFQCLAGHQLSRHYGVWLAPGCVAGIADEFGLVSADRRVVGAALFWDAASGGSGGGLLRMTEWVWRLEHVAADRVFVVVGFAHGPLVEWLSAHVDFLERTPSRVAFFALDADGALELLASPDAPFRRAVSPPDAASQGADEHPLFAFAGRFRNDPVADEVDAYIHAARERERAEAARSSEAS